MSEGNGSTAADSRSNAPEKYPNLRPPWQPGKSANPAGMPKGTKHIRKRLNNALKRYIRDHPGCEYAIAGALVEEAMTRPKTTIEVEGKTRTTTVQGQCWPQAQKLIWDRRDGLLTQKHEHKGAVIIAVRGLDP